MFAFRTFFTPPALLFTTSRHRMLSVVYTLVHCERDGHTVHKLTQRRLTADILARRKSDCSRMRSKVFSDWLPSYVKATRPVIEIFKMAAYFPDSPRISYWLRCCFFGDTAAGAWKWRRILIYHEVQCLWSFTSGSRVGFRGVDQSRGTCLS